jgi:hypothetical protein
MQRGYHPVRVLQEKKNSIDTVVRISGRVSNG